MIRPALVAKRFQILKEVFPRLTRVATIGCGGVGYQLQWSHPNSCSAPTASSNSVSLATDSRRGLLTADRGFLRLRSRTPELRGDIVVGMERQGSGSR